MGLDERLINYCESILNGDILACKKHKQAVKRFLNDLQQQQDDTFTYYFDLEAVGEFNEWAKMFKHTKGVLANKPIELTDFQLFVVANIFGWKHKETQYRRFKKSYIQLARKNAKSQLLSLMASYEAFLSGEKAEIYIAGWDKEKSNIVYKEVLTQIKKCDLLQGKFTDSYHTITHVKSESIIKALSREGKNMDGLNPSLSIIDEYHGHKTSEIYDVLVSGMVARPNGHICVITTAGFDLNAPCFTEYKYISKILDENDPTQNENYFAIVCELDENDDFTDPKTWIKANPIVATYKEGLESLKEEMQIALDVPEKMRNYKTKNLNIWCDDKPSGYLPMNKWAACKDNFEFSDFEGMEALVGVDLSAKRDLTSISFLFVKDSLVYVLSHSFMPEETVQEKEKTDRAPYRLWIEQGYITATPGAVVDYNYIEKYLEDVRDQYKIAIKEVCVDTWNASQFMQSIEQKGFLPVEIIQGMRTLGPPTEEFRNRVYAETIRHNENPVLTFAISNAITREDHNQNIMLDKKKSTERIDPIASTINAMVRLHVLENEEIDLNSHILSDDFSF